MEWFAKKVLRHKKFVTAVFLATACLGGILMTGVNINYSLSDYLPEDAPSTVGLSAMEKEFKEEIPNARVMVEGVSVMEALEYKKKLEEISGVSSVLWLDDAANLRQPVETLSPSVRDSYYKDGNALFLLTVQKGKELKTTDEIYSLIGEKGFMDDQAAVIAFSQRASVTESLNAILVLLPVILVILTFMSTSWIEPLLYLSAIGVSVLINMGSNIFLGEVSYITVAISPILQMAVSLDYAIFLLHSFEEERKWTDDKNTAMVRAMRRAFSSVAASAATTLFGFMALIFMRFQLGSDLGINLVKGIIFSYISSMVFLPALTLMACGWLDKTRHKKLIPELKGLSKILMRIRIPAFILMLFLIIPCFRAQQSLDFIYGVTGFSEKMKTGEDSKKISAVFGKATTMVLLVPTQDEARQKLLCEELKNLNGVTSLISYTDTVGAGIPTGFLDRKIVNKFYSGDYARIILTSDQGEEGDAAFALVEEIRSLVEKYYDKYYSTGQSAVLYDMKKVISGDNRIVNTIAVAAITLTLALTFKAFIPLLPFLLLLVIESAIWINLAVSYFMGQSLIYIGFLVINTVQLGATIDYAIFITNNYMLKRRKMKKAEALLESLSESLAAVMTSALILSSAGFCLMITSSNPVVADLGLLIGRGTLLSLLAVAAVLPMPLLLFDRVVGATVFHSDFYKEGKKCDKQISA